MRPTIGPGTRPLTSLEHTNTGLDNNSTANATAVIHTIMVAMDGLGTIRLWVSYTTLPSPTT